MQEKKLINIKYNRIYYQLINIIIQMDQLAELINTPIYEITTLFDLIKMLPNKIINHDPYPKFIYMSNKNLYMSNLIILIFIVETLSILVEAIL